VELFRPMLLYFGYYRDLSGKLWTSYDKEIPKSVLIDWFRLGWKHIFWIKEKYLQELRSNVIHVSTPFADISDIIS